MGSFEIPAQHIEQSQKKILLKNPLNFSTNEFTFKKSTETAASGKKPEVMRK